RVVLFGGYPEFTHIGDTWERGCPPDCEPCDTNCDATVDALDIEPFLGLLFDPKPDPCAACTGDTNGDGQVNALDIEPFLECLFGP
ncbi:MAG: hypothetical protein IID33_12820, partial [Planctomycetes bacterium]|nr:hypothetical protein [Planctomycetota bacterium]